MILRHTDGAATLYAHLSAVNLRNPNPNFRRGAEVKAGEVIALSDNMGHSTAPHLHFEYVPGGPIVRSNYRIDPYPCIGGQTEDRIRPTIDRVDPNPVTGSNSPQRFTIYGRNFHSQATVTLRDLRTGEVFPNRPIEAHSRSDTQLVINPRFTEVAAQWDVQVINPGGLGSNRYEFDVIPPGTQVVKLTAADAAAHHRFGHAVAIDGDIMSVSALHSVGSDGYYEVYTGAVYVFERQGANWVEQAKLTPPPSDDFFPIEGWDAFGSSVAISGGTIIVGAPAFEASDLPYGSNAVYVFEREGSSWVQKGKLEGYHVYPAHARDSVGIYGNTVVIGDTALYDEGYLIRPGYVHVFERVGGTCLNG